MQEYSLASRQEGRREPLRVYYVSREREARIASFLSSWEEGRNGNEPLLTEALYSLHPKEALTAKYIQIICCKMTTYFCSLTHHLSPQNLRQRVGARVTSQNVSHGNPRKSASGTWYQWDVIADMAPIHTWISGSTNNYHPKNTFFFFFFSNSKGISTGKVPAI